MSLDEQISLSSDEAIEFCRSFFYSSMGFQACNELPLLQADKYIADCAVDIEVYAFIHIFIYDDKRYTFAYPFIL